MRTPRKPARTSRSICAFAPASVGARTASSVAPSTSAGPPARAAGARTNAVARTTHMRRIVALIDLATVARAMEERVKGQLTTLPAQAGGLSLPGRERRRPLRGQGEVAPPARPLVLPEGPGRPGADRAAAEPGREHRGDRHRLRGRGAPPRAEPREAPPAAVQRAPARRQVVPVHRGHGRGRVPARDVHARAAPARRLVLRPVREREEGARDARRPQPRLPLPAVRGPEARTALRHPVPRLPHRALPGAVRRLRLEGGLPRDHRQRHRVPLRRRTADPARARAEDERRRPGGAVRGRGALPQPALRGAAPRRAAGGRAAVGWDCRHRRLRVGRPIAPSCRSSRCAAARWSTGTRSISRMSKGRT